MKRKRDNKLIAKRNRKICARYYYWTEEQRLRSDDAIRLLAQEEFFLSEATILQILRRAQTLANSELKAAAPFKHPKLPVISKEMLQHLNSEKNK